MPPASQSKLYNPRHPERTLLYQTVAEHYATWLELANAGQFDGQGDYRTPKPYVRQAFDKYLECGIFAHGFARARCADCAHDYFVAFSCKGRGVCPSCNTRRMAETAAHLTDHVFPRLPVRQWVLSVPKRLRYFMQRDGAVLNMVLRIFLRVVAKSLQSHSPGAAHVDKAALHIGAVAFIHRFGSSLNEHVHFHVCVVDGVFEEVASGADAEPQAVADDQSSPSKVIFHPVRAIDETAVAQVQATLRRRVLRAFVGRGLLESFEAKEMLAYKHGGFSVDTSVRIEANDRAGLQRLLRYCARPPFSMERLRKAGNDLVYRCAKQHSEPGGDWRADQRGVKQRGGNQQRNGHDEITLTPLELINRIAALTCAPAQTSAGEGATGAATLASVAILPESEPQPMAPKRSPAHYLWAALIARIYEVFPLLCPLCGGQMHIIAFITYSVEIRQILDHIGVESEPPRLSPVRGPPLWDECDADAQRGEGDQTELGWDLQAQSAPDYEVDQRLSW